MSGYSIAPDGKSITCQRCGMTSHHPKDVAEKYCGHCHVFHDDQIYLLDIDLTKIESVALRRLIEEVRNPNHAYPPPGYYDRVYHRHNR
jgi:hypothetical protein